MIVPLLDSIYYTNLRQSNTDIVWRDFRRGLCNYLTDNDVYRWQINRLPAKPRFNLYKNRCSASKILEQIYIIAHKCPTDYFAGGLITKKRMNDK